MTKDINMKAAFVGIDILHPVLTSLYETGCEIMKIFSCRTDNVTEFNTKTVSFAKEHDIPLQLDRITQDDLFDLVAMGCDFVLVGGYYYVIPVIEELRIVNTHPAFLPIGRGAWPMPLTILKGLTESGITMHRMTRGLDEGAIILQEKIPVYPKEDTLITLTRRQNQMIPAMVRRLVSDFDNLWDNAIPQDESIAEYWEMPGESDYTVTDHMTYDRADLILRAFKGYECFYVDSEDNSRYEIIDGVAYKSEDMSGVPSSALKIHDGYILCERIRRIQ